MRIGLESYRHILSPHTWGKPHKSVTAFFHFQPRKLPNETFKEITTGQLELAHD